MKHLNCFYLFLIHKNIFLLNPYCKMTKDMNLEAKNTKETIKPRRKEKKVKKKI